MKTDFTDSQRADPFIARNEDILKSCVHCGMCTATCPSYQILGDELDSPRGRIYMIKSLMEEGRAPDENFVRHIDQCLSCLACTTTCPSGVDYMHLIDDARAHIEENYKRPFMDRYLRKVLAMIIPYPKRFRLAMMGAGLARPFRFLFGGRIRAMLELAPKQLPKQLPIDKPQTHSPKGERKKRVAILAGCAQSVLDPEIHRATISVLTKLGVEVVHPKGAGCCGALVHHMGRVNDAHDAAMVNINAWLELEKIAPLDAIIINTSGCGTTIKDYGHMIETDEARRVSELAKDISEFLIDIFPQTDAPEKLKIAYHSACSLQHGQKIKETPKELLKRAGFEVVEPFESHLCCGSAGTYNMLQPEISTKLGARKASNIERLKPDAIAAGNIGCMTQIGAYSRVPIAHTIQFLDWALGGEKPS